MDNAEVMKVAERVAINVIQKNEAYGDAVTKVAKIMEVLYPDGIPVEQYKDALLMVRSFDKFCRKAHNNDEFGENPWLDLTGYALIGATQEEV